MGSTHLSSNSIIGIQTSKHQPTQSSILPKSVNENSEVTPCAQVVVQPAYIRRIGARNFISINNTLLLASLFACVTIIFSVKERLTLLECFNSFTHFSYHLACCQQTAHSQAKSYVTVKQHQDRLTLLRVLPSLCLLSLSSPLASGTLSSSSSSSPSSSSSSSSSSPFPASD